MPDMRFAPPPSLKITDRGGGLNQISVRTYNERLVMSLLRQHQNLSRLELGQYSGLSAQTISVIVRALERDGLILRGAAQRGKVGPPTIPMTLNPEGAYSFGIKIGRKTTDVVLINFLGDIVSHTEFPYSYPKHQDVVDYIKKNLKTALNKLSATQCERLAGIGLSLPQSLENWPEKEWPTQQQPQPWDSFNFETELERATGLATYIQNDVTAAASAEILFGGAKSFDDFAYFFVGENATVRLVLDHRVYAGKPGKKSQIEQIPSIENFEHRLELSEDDRLKFWRYEADWSSCEDKLDGWLDDCSSVLAKHIVMATQFVDIETAIIDGRMPREIALSLCLMTSEKIRETKTTTNIVVGQIGSLAKSIGAASMPFHAKFMVQEIGLATD